MRSSALLGLFAASIFACSGEPTAGLDGVWDGDPDATGPAADAATVKDTGTTPSDAAIVNPVDAAPVTDAAVKDASAPVDAALNCLNGVASPGSGHHHPGTDCMSCHDGLSANKRWTVAGTLYTTANGNTAISGANIEIIDSANKKVVLATEGNGNFYTTQAFAFPVKVRASKCPNDAKMTGNATGSCNSNSCHNSSMRIHLP